MRGFFAAALTGLVCGIFCLPVARSQSSAEWTTNSADPQRDGWQRHETRINTHSVQRFHLLWSVKTGNKPTGTASMTEPVILSDVQTPAGKMSLAIIAGSSDNIYGIDAETGKMIWQKHLPWLSDEPQNPLPQRGFICENALTDSPVATSAGNSGHRYVYILSVDGYLHTLDAATGAEQGAPIQVLPRPYGKAYGLNLRGNVIYTTTGQGCGGVPNTIYRIDLTTRQVSTMSPAQSGIWGFGGPAIAPDGTLFIATGDGIYDAAALRLSTSVLEVNPTDLKIENYFTPSDHVWLTQRDLDLNFTPVIFPFHGRELLVVSGKEGRFYMLDTKSMGGTTHQIALYETPLVSNTDVNLQTEGSWGGGASWEGPKGTRWLLMPIGGPINPEVKFPITHGPTPDGGIVAMKVAERNGKPELIPAWVSGDMVTSLPPAVANGVVFALAAGEFPGQADDYGGGTFSAPEKVERSVPAVLYALDAETGKELWSSGKQVTSFAHLQSGMAVAGGRVIFGTNDGTVYCFGLK